MDYGKRLKELREYHNLSQYDVADLLNIKRSSYNQFEQQYDIIPIKRLNDLANIFNCSIDYILNLNNDKSYPNSKKEIDSTKSGIILKDFRKEVNLTQVKLASILNTVHSVITNYENGKNFIATPFLYDICKKYNISADYLLGKIDNPKYLK
ncbi:MAG: helix-turn-helix domain-containing protein [Ruminococcus sp.]|nr:helix-turn-helix domain-containing protein [Ruminococcus sp.]